MKSVDEAVQWAKRCPNPMPGEVGVLEIRPFYEMADFDHMMTDEIREREGRVRKIVEKQQKQKKQKKQKPKAAAKTKKAPAKAKARVKAKRKTARAKSKK